MSSLWCCGGSPSVDMRAQHLGDKDLMSYCHACGFDFRTAAKVEPILYDAQATSILRQASHGLELDHEQGSTWNLDSYSVMHQLSKTLATRYKHSRLRNFVQEELGIQDIALNQGQRSFEMRSIEHRHHLVQLAAWLLADLEPRLISAWRARAIRYNVLLKDFPHRPQWYSDVVEALSDWRFGIS